LGATIKFNLPYGASKSYIPHFNYLTGNYAKHHVEHDRNYGDQGRQATEFYISNGNDTQLTSMAELYPSQNWE
jgi:hypothetical protein